MATNDTAIVFSPTLAQDFDINYAVKLGEFSTEFATAYEAKSRISSTDTAEYYALVFNKFFPADLDKINRYKALRERNLQELFDYGRVQTAKGEALCCVFKKPAGIKLSELLQRNIRLEESVVLNQIFNQMFAGLSLLHSNGIMHGSINLNNIYYNTQNASISLRECVSEFVGFSQKAVYETLDRMVCHPAGKSPRDLSADLYAAGVVVASLIGGKEVMSGMSEDAVRRAKFEIGSYDAILGITVSKSLIEPSPKGELLLRGILHDKNKERWLAKQVIGWQRREAAVPAQSRVHRQTSTSFQFDNVDYFSPKYLAYVMFQNWGSTKKNLKLIDLTRWLSQISRVPDIEKRLILMARSDQTEIIIPDEKLARVIYLLDEEGPIRYKDVSFHPDGLGSLFAYCLFKNDLTNINNLSVALDLGFIEGWISHQENQDPYKPSALGWNPKKIKIYIRRNEPGFGSERCLYELNPYLPCLSPLLENTYSVTLAGALTALNQGRLNGKEIDNDKHLTAYICCHAGIEEPIRIKPLQQYPFFNKNMALKMAAMFAVAHQKSGIDKLPGIASWLRQSLTPVTEKFNSNSIRKSVTANLDAATSAGDLNRMFSTISDPKMIRKDVFGFNDAKKTYKILTFEMLKLNSQSNMDQLAYRMGLRVAVIFSYLVCTITILSIMFINL